MLLDQLWDPDYLERNQVVSMAQHDHTHVASSQKALMLEMKSLQEQPVEGFKITLVNEADMYNWEVAIFGPPNTHYEGGYFKVRVKNSAKCPRNLCSSFDNVFGRLDEFNRANNILHLSPSVVHYSISKATRHCLIL